ncbi:hypothetical protein FJZ36_02455 [Candidatus Poribacteria bacterium]|nr:hypothetical protein [Candidatus Poribacteria bacterium]
MGERSQELITTLIWVAIGLGVWAFRQLSERRNRDAPTPESVPEQPPIDDWSNSRTERPSERIQPMPRVFMRADAAPSTATAHGRADLTGSKVCLVHCIDPRIQQMVESFRAKSGITYGHFDRVSVAGGAGFLDDYQDEVAIAFTRHEVRDIVLTGHDDCLAGTTRGGVLDAAGQLRERYGSSVRVHAIWFHLDGTHDVLAGDPLTGQTPETPATRQDTEPHGRPPLAPHSAFHLRADDRSVRQGIVASVILGKPRSLQK